MMALRFTNRRRPVSASDLTVLERAQLVEAAGRLDGEDLTIERRLRPPDPDAKFEDEFSLQGLVSGWDIVDGQTHRFTAWLLCGFSGTVFEADSMTVVGSVIDKYLQDCVSTSLHAELIEANRHYRESHPRPWPELAVS